MNRLAVIASIAAALVAPIPAPLSGQPAPGRAYIGITSTVEGVRLSHDGRVFKYLLWNRNITARPIGHAFMSCRFGPGTVRVCTAIYTLPHGRIVVASEIHTLRKFHGVIVGGSRSQRAVREGRPGYLGVIGSARSIRVGPGTYSLTFVLEP